jgi:[protein-PII] uridylyltransferase
LLDRADLVGGPLRAALTAHYDQWLAGRLADADGVALVAVGGLGRRETAPWSDLDLVLLHRGRRDVAGLADAIWYPIWDAGLSLDHSVRTVAEAVTVARSDLRAALGLLDLRHVAGDPALTVLLRESVLAAWRADAARRLPELHEATTARWASQGELAFLLEPDLKESHGGLRDVHALQALAAAQFVEPPGPAVAAARDVLLDVRGELHRRSGRALDRLVAQEQAGIGAALGRGDANSLLRSVNEAGRVVAFAADTAWRRVTAELEARRRRWLPGRRPPAAVRRPLAEGVVEQDGEVVLARDADPWADPVLVLRAATAAARTGRPLAPHALDRLATESAPLGTPWPASARDAFVDLLGAGRAAVPVLESLDRAGLLVRLLPEWEPLRSLPQRNPVHRFTVDRHLTETAANAAELTRTVSRPDLLLLGALFHDIGKGWPGDHTEAGVQVVRALGPRLGLSYGDAATLVAMVQHHLLLPDTATRRDLDDPVTVRTVVDAVAGSRDLLDLLHALSIADGLATGPAAWTEWKAALVAQLVDRAASVLSGSPLPIQPPLTADQRALADPGTVAVRVDGDAVVVAAPDAPGLLSRTTGVLALHQLDVRSATIATVRDGACHRRVPDTAAMAVNVFQVTPRFGRGPDPALLRADVVRALAGSLPLADQLAAKEKAYAPTSSGAAGVGFPPPPRVLWFDDAATDATVLELRAADAMGLLHRVTGALEQCGLDVRAARVSTLGGAVVDAFYVVGPDGRPVTDPALRTEVEAAVLAAVD